MADVTIRPTELRNQVLELRQHGQPFGIAQDFQQVAHPTVLVVSVVWALLEGLVVSVRPEGLVWLMRMAVG